MYIFIFMTHFSASFTFVSAAAAATQLSVHPVMRADISKNAHVTVF